MHYILWRVDYLTLRMMLLDQPRYVPPKEQENNPAAPTAPASGADDGSDIAAAFSTELQRFEKR